MSEMGAAKFKAQCLQVMEKVRRTRQPVVITKRGVPVAKLVPADPAPTGTPFGCMAAETQIVGDITAPLWTDAEWREFEEETARQIAGTSKNLAPRSGRRRSVGRRARRR